MPKFTERTALKEVVKFAKREFREKKPLNVRVLRVRDEKVFSIGGPIPAITVRATQVPYYIVVLDYGDVYRLYNYTKDGALILGENVEKGSDKMKEIEKSTKLEYKIPKI
jgi:hypothetical protein